MSVLPSLNSIRVGINILVKEEAYMSKTKASFLYMDDRCHFMNQETFEQFDFPKDKLGDGVKFLKEGIEVSILNFNNEPVDIELPKKVTLKVTDSPPGVKGDTAGNASKQATLETGLVVNVPLFIKTGEEIVVNTDT